ncbi:MAG: hypothetical protein WCE94_15680 [Candidatus Methanoperedens sp.]
MPVTKQDMEEFYGEVVELRKALSELESTFEDQIDLIVIRVIQLMSKTSVKVDELRQERKNELGG